MEHEGEMIIEQKNGAVAILDSEGKMQITNKNGVVKLNHCNGTLALDHQNGSIKILKAGFSEASVKTENSGIYYEFEKVSAGNFSFGNSHGKTTLIIPDELEYNIKAKNIHGKIQIGLDKDFEMKGDGEK
jgi:hypothetical protein